MEEQEGIDGQCFGLSGLVPDQKAVKLLRFLACPPNSFNLCQQELAWFIFFLLVLRKEKIVT